MLDAGDTRKGPDTVMGKQKSKVTLRFEVKIFMGMELLTGIFRSKES